jgi:hypothetical protein
MRCNTATQLTNMSHATNSVIVLHLQQSELENYIPNKISLFTVFAEFHDMNFNTRIQSETEEETKRQNVMKILI